MSFRFLKSLLKTTANDQSNATTKEGKPGLRCETKALEERHNKDGQVETVERNSAGAGWKGQHGEYSLVAIHFNDKEGKLTKKTLRVNSPHLLNVFKKIISFYPTQPSGFDDPITLESPFAMLYHYRDDLLKYRAQVSDADGVCKSHLDLLASFMKDELAEVSQHSEKMASKGFVRFKYLWAIFKPGDLVYESMHGHGRLYELEDTSYLHTQSKGDFFHVHCSFIDYDGTNVGKARTTIEISERM